MASITTFSERPVRLFFQDEARVGLHLPKYRRLTARGVCPVQPFDPVYEYYWLYGAFEPATGMHDIINVGLNTGINRHVAFISRL